ncbi:hypothetical protein Ciccas_002698 [Cichlidogyrus casuarinus]|uniref:Uncharacterized protein n=1 Tax=Cichlidogyrus casuarinus TaxID=1844966 RepID=A0ABD2QGW8_9PLAT
MLLDHDCVDLPHTAAIDQIKDTTDQQTAKECGYRPGDRVPEGLHQFNANYADDVMLTVLIAG